MKVDLSLYELELVKRLLTERSRPPLPADPEVGLQLTRFSDCAEKALESRNPVVDGVLLKIHKALRKLCSDYGD